MILNQYRLINCSKLAVLAKIDFSKYLRFALYDYKRLAIPGLGVINLQRNSAFADVKNQQVYPPRYDIKFDSDITADSLDTYEFIQAYVPELSRSEFDGYMNARILELSSYGKTAIEGIGILTKDTSGITFEPYEETSNLLTYGLNRLGLNKISNMFNTKSMNEARPLPNVSSSWIVFLPLLIAALLIACSLIYWNSTVKTPSIIRDNKITITRPVSVDTTKTNIIIDTTSNVKLDRVAIVSDILKNSDGSYIKKCVIITGAFKSGKYRDLMIERLRANGYDIFVEKKGQLTRVGLQFECHEKDLEKYLQAVRETLEKDAWYLDDLVNKEG